jgi:hypothetical protein
MQRILRHRKVHPIEKINEHPQRQQKRNAPSAPRHRRKVVHSLYQRDSTTANERLKRAQFPTIYLRRQSAVHSALSLHQRRSKIPEWNLSGILARRLEIIENMGLPFTRLPPRLAILWRLPIPIQTIRRPKSVSSRLASQRLIVV